MVKSVICDVDGCLIPPRGEFWDYAGLGQIARVSQAGRLVFTMCSGRPAAFMEALARMLMVSTYCICENGSVLMHPLTKEFLVHPDVPAEYMRERPAILARLHQMVAGTPVVIEFGKEVMISVNSPDKSVLGELVANVRKELAGAPVEVMNSGRSAEVVPRGVTKAAGLAFWAEKTGHRIEDVISVGDADNDLAILQAAGTAAAPANCTPGVRAVAHYVSPEPMVCGVLDILQRVEAGRLG